MPERVDVVDDALLRWDPDLLHETDPSPSFLGVLDEFIDLASAQPQEMADFLEVYGLPELPSITYIVRPGVDSASVSSELPVTWLRAAARFFAATRRAARQLAGRQTVPPADAKDIGVFMRDPFPPAESGYQAQRAALAKAMTWLLGECRVYPRAEWPDDRRFYVRHEASSLLGALAIELAREIGRGEIAYRCSVCGVTVNPKRPPREGEDVYCASPKCRREQQRRNQAAWRARKKETAT